MRAPLIEFAFWAVITAILWWQTRHFAGDTIAEYAFGADGWVRVVLLGIMLGAAGQLALAILASRKTPQPETPDSATSPSPSPATSTSNRLQHALIFIAPLVYLYLMQRLGFFFLTPFFIIGYLWILQVRKWQYLILVASAVYAVVLLIFVRIFYVALPVGSWEAFYNINTLIITLVRWGV